MIIYFIRHGQTEDNIRGIIQGQIDTPLNDHGRSEARLLATRLKDVNFDEAWSSSLSRARETAEIVLQHHPDLNLRTDPGLMERGLGSLEGKSRPEGLWNNLPKDVEPTDVFRRRITNWLTTFLDSQPPYDPTRPGSELTILVLSHGAYLTTLFSILLHLPFSFIIPDDLDPHAPCVNTSIMKVHIRARKEVMYADEGSKRGGWGLYLESLRRLEALEMREDLRTGKKVRSGWVGMVQSWADAGHLDEQVGESVGVADDLGDTE